MAWVARAGSATRFFALAPGIVENGQNATLPGAPLPSAAALALHETLVIGDWHSDALLWDRDLRKRSTRADSVVAAIGLLGEDHVSLGSDFDGAVVTPIDSSQLASLTQVLLDKGLNEAVITKVMGGNMMRYLAEVLP